MPRLVVPVPSLEFGCYPLILAVKRKLAIRWKIYESHQLLVQVEFGSMVATQNYLIPIADLRRHVDPLDGALWGCARITVAEVHAAAAAGLFPTETWDRAEVGMRAKRDSFEARDWHIRRIAKFVSEGIPSDEHIIALQVDDMDPSRKVVISNGNHRIAGAMIRNEPAIIARVTAIEPGEVQRVFPNATPV